MNKYQRLDDVKKYSKKNTNKLPTRIHANSLFKFMKKPNYLQEIIKNKRIYPRYVIEPVKYLKLKSIQNVALPMICFCDINLHNLDAHIDRYGSYGIALSKEWGIKNNIQPVQYINKNSALRKDFTFVANKALEEDVPKSDENYINYLFHQLMFFKPYESKTKGKTQRFADECEWRHIAQVSIIDYPMIIYDEKQLDAMYLQNVSQALAHHESIGLSFDYTDIKYLIVSNKEDFEDMILTIKGLQLDDQTIYSLLSKVLIWDECMEDF